MWLIVIGFALSGFAHAFSPQTGTWVFDDEENGKPGRGLSLDIQNGILVVSMYGYESNGQPTFYAGANKLEYVASSPNSNGPIQKATIDLIRYTGGRFLGSDAKEAVAAGSVGKAEFTFSHGTRGVVKLPGEQAKKIGRYVFGSKKLSTEEMLGGWFFVSASSGTFSTEFFYFTSLKEVEVAPGSKRVYAVSNDNRMRCIHSTGPYFSIDFESPLISTKDCEQLDAQGKVLKSYRFDIGVNDGQGTYSSDPNNRGTVYVYRVRNFDGIGVGVMPGLNGPVDPSLLR